MNCLDIPIPQCVQALVQGPPHSCVKLEDSAILSLIQDFGRKHHLPQDEIQQACNLGSGMSDVLIILERPAPRHDYSVDFNKFVADCPTLRATDQLIKFSSKGQRTIHNVTILDAFSFQPNKNRPCLTEPWFDVLERLVKLKRPKVILCCWSGPCEHPFISKLRSLGLGSKSVREYEDEAKTFLIRSFHPATVVCYGERKVHSRMLLICHFVMAFAQLGEKLMIPEWIDSICEKSAKASR